MSACRVLLPNTWSSVSQTRPTPFEGGNEKQTTKPIENNMNAGASKESAAKVHKEILNPPEPRKPPNTSSIVTRSQYSAGLGHSIKDSENTAPDSPNSCLPKKRAGQVEEVRDVGGRSSPTEVAAAPMGAGDPPTHVCLCQPEPKIPRPRNAFILYRQHHQASVVAQNPGLANPEISKIIGDQWQAQPESVKSEWKALAEEEKLRHQQQYPEYRYQPRRGGKGTDSASPTSGNADKYRCNKCGGRSIRTPTTPFPPSSGPTPILPPPIPSSNAPSPSTRFLPMMNNLSLASPQVRRAQRIPTHLSSINAPNTPDSASFSPLSPDVKRRRFNGASFPPTSARTPNGTQHPYPLDARRGSLPRPDQLLRGSPPNSARLMPPPPPRAHGSHHDMNLTLPPLQTGNDQSRSVEAMVMSMSYLGKIRILGKIAPPLRPPGPMSPSTTVRGAVIAIEGEDDDAVTSLVSFLEGFLAKSGEFHTRVEHGPVLPLRDRQVSLVDYLDVIKEWHGRSKDIVKFITTPAPPTSYHTRRSEESTNDGDACMIDILTKPVVILPMYQLRATDAYASRIPINDSYSPADHWQWIATLWRNIIGPDLTVYIKGVTTEELPREKHVDVKEEAKCLIVRKDRRSPKLEDSTLRRIGFEVEEWIRSIGTEKEGN